MFRAALLWLCILCACGSKVQNSTESNVDNTVFQSDRRTLTWFPSTNGGLFSHFFQVRYINKIANDFNRTLVIAPHNSIHATDARDVIMCDVLDLRDMVCVTEPPTSKKKCVQDLDLSAVDAALHPCFGGHNIWGSISLFDVMRLGPPLRFQHKFVQHYLQVRDSFLAAQRAAHPGPSAERYLVVHWRRGDQLSTRCLPDWKGYKDNSINCQSAAALVADIRQYLQSQATVPGWVNVSAVLVATNEQNATVLDQLRRESFVPMSDLFKQHSEPPAAGGNRSSLDEFVAEAQFMLHAPLFASYGISQINDVIESERAKYNRSHCIRQEQVDHKSWCEGLRFGRHLPRAERQKLALNSSFARPVQPPGSKAGAEPMRLRKKSGSRAEEQAEAADLKNRKRSDRADSGDGGGQSDVSEKAIKAALSDLRVGSGKNKKKLSAEEKAELFQELKDQLLKQAPDEEVEAKPAKKQRAGKRKKKSDDEGEGDQ